MSIYNLFSKRKKQPEKTNQNTYTYEVAPIEFRVQVIHILKDIIGDGYVGYKRTNINLYEFIVDQLCREYGVFVLPPCEEEELEDKAKQLVEFILKEKNVDRLLDAIELSFSVMESHPAFLTGRSITSTVEEAINELNYRFREHQLGFQYNSGQILRVDSQLIHEKVEKPALSLLSTPGYKGVQDEFLKAHEHYRLGNNKEALVECLKSFESTMKVICKKHHWQYDEKTATVSKLIKVCLEHGLIPKFWKDHYTALEQLLESGIPTGRNRLGGHGQGAEVITVPQHLVAYMLHMTASAIVFLVESEKNLS